MMKPDFSQMSRPELRAYVIRNREDDEAIEYLIKTMNPNSPVYPPPQTEKDLEEMQKLFQKRIEQSERSRKQ